MQPVMGTAPNSGIPAGARKDDAEDMTGEQWKGLVGGLLQFLGEEAAEPEHASDAVDGPKTLYVSRPLLNGDELAKWARAAGFKKTLAPDDFHVTIAYSKTPVDWAVIGRDFYNPDKLRTNGGDRSVERLGDKGAIVLRFDDSNLEDRWDEIRNAGASWDHDGYRPHVTFTFADEAGDVDLDGVEPFKGTLVFGPEKMAELGKNDGWFEKAKAGMVGDAEAMPLAAGIQYTDPNGNVLLLKRSAHGDHGGTWAFPAGGVEAGETPEEAARRESVEETGHEPEGELKLLDRSASGQGAFHTFVNHVREQFEPELNDEHTDYVWAHPDNPPDPLHPGVANLFGASGKGPLAKDAREFEHEAVVRYNGDFNMGKFLRTICAIGDGGHSFDIVLDPDDRENAAKFGWDGDGADRIVSAEIDGADALKGGAEDTEFVESEHPRAPDGKFGAGSGSSASGRAKSNKWADAGGKVKRSEDGMYKAYDKKGRLAGALIVDVYKTPKEVFNVNVKEPFRRQGAAAAMYRAAEADFGELTPSSALSDEGFAFWSGFRPESVRDDLRTHRENLMGKSVKSSYGEGKITSVGRHAAIATTNGKESTWPVPKQELARLIESGAEDESFGRMNEAKGLEKAKSFHAVVDPEQATDHALARQNEINRLAMDALTERQTAEGKLSGRQKSAIGSVGSEKRDEMPDDVFLEPGSKKYPVKEKGAGGWKYARKLLLAAARRARMNGNSALAKRADAIRAREFGAAEDAADDFSDVEVDAEHDGPWLSCMAKDGSRMYRNRNVPAEAEIDGETVKVDDVLKHHEVPEWSDLENLISVFREEVGREPDEAERKVLYQGAHGRSGTPNERAYCERSGINWKAWSAWCRGQEAKVEKGPFENEPADADVKPIPHGHGDLAATDSVFMAMDRDSLREFDRDGRMHVKTVNLSKANVCPYRGKEIPGWDEETKTHSLGLDPDRIYQLLRDPDELARAAPSFNGIQLLSVHEPVDVDDHRMWDIVGTTGSEAKFEPPYLTNSLHIWTKDGVKLIESGKQKELSCGYFYRPDMTPGSYQGQHYDGVMRDLAGNHVALVKDGRAGDDVVVGDSIDSILWANIEREVGKLLAA